MKKKTIKRFCQKSGNGIRKITSDKRMAKNLLLSCLMGGILLVGGLLLSKNGGEASYLSVETKETGLEQEAEPVQEVFYTLKEAKNWGLGFSKTAGEQPTGNASKEELAKYDAYYIGDKEEKVLYLTFDCGFENGNTEQILDALKKHDVKATFFVVGHFLESAPDIVRRIESEGHIVGNHTFHHPDMTKISEKDSFISEINAVRELYQEITGKEMSMYYRPPQGKYSTENLLMAQELGYRTIFWSLAYVDWKQDDQPTREEALEKMVGRIHPGAIVLLHNTSSTNAQVLDELLTEWEKLGYSVRPLTDLTE